MKADRRFDVRTVERNIQKGLLTREEYHKYLANLADQSAKCEDIHSTMESVTDFSSLSDDEPMSRNYVAALETGGALQHDEEEE